MPSFKLDGHTVKTFKMDGHTVKQAKLDGHVFYKSEFLIELTGNIHNVTKDLMWAVLVDNGGVDATDIRFIIHSNVELVTDSPSYSLFDFYGPWGGKNITIENYGYILGRGGTGGNEGQTGGTGGTAITNENANLTIINHGVIGGGGGGGGGSYLGASYGGGGGAPFAGGGWGSGASGPGASFTTPGSGTSWAGRVAGAGGAWGNNGEGGNGGGGGAAGAATRGPINWEYLGDVRGARV